MPSAPDRSDFGQEPAPQRERPTHVRYIVLLFMATAAASAYLTRTLGAANTTIAEEFKVSNAQMGDVLAGFAFGYFFFQVPGGMVASRYGVRGALALMAIAWSLCTVAKSFAPSAQALEFSRFMLGVAQAGFAPCAAKVIADWFPASRRGIASSFVTASMQIGAIGALWLTARLLGPLGWRSILQLYSVVGLVWGVSFYLWFRDRPEDHPRVNLAERELIRERAPQAVGALPPVQTSDRSGSWTSAGLAMLCSVTMWAFCAQAFFRAYAYEFFITWFPAYLEKGFGVSKEAAGSLSAIPQTVLLVGSVAAGWLVDAVYCGTGSKYLSRNGAAIAGLGLTGLTFFAACWITDPLLLVAVVSVGAFLSALGGPATWAVGIDIGGRYTPVLIGVMNMTGNMGAYLCPRHVGRLFDYIQTTPGASWTLVLYLFVAINLAGAVSWIAVNPNARLDGTARNET